MMQTKTTLLLISSILLLVTNCKKKEITPEGEPIPGWRFTFMFADSLGNNLLPYSLPKNPVRNPDDFRAYSLYETPDFNYYYSRHEIYGHTFRLGYKNKDEIAATENFQKDSIFRFIICFGNNCDTVIIKPDIDIVTYNTKVISECRAQWVVWSRDTTFNYPCGFFPLKP
jgi:hypothetical protein